MIKITSKGLKEFQSFAAKLPKGIRVGAMRAIAEYIVGDNNHGLKHEPSWKFVSRAKAYGKVSDAPPGYFSWGQFRFVAWKTKGFTAIPQSRTHQISESWKINDTDDWRRVKISNDADGAEWVVGEKQARQPKLVGWRKFAEVVKTNTRGALRAGQQAVDRWIKANSR